jgi:crossover junction endodeoxyribonuclease RusA
VSATPLNIELGWPAKELSPNARVHHMVKHRYAKAAKNEAGWATKMVRPFDWGSDGPFAVHICAHPAVNRQRDADNLIASLKSHLDGIATVLGVNDSTFKAPTLEWGDISNRAHVVVTITPVTA